EPGQVGHLLESIAGAFGKLVGSAKVAGVLVGHKPLEGADGDWLVYRSSAAGSLVRGTADAYADRGERIWPPGNQVRRLIVARCDRADVAPGVGVHRAGELALDLTAPILLVGHRGR